MAQVRNPVAEFPDRRGTILVVEDDHDLRELQSLMLRLQGYLVFEAADGVQALAVLRRVRPDVILLDLQMPNMTGWQFIERLRVDPSFDEIPICVVTAELVPGNLKVAGVVRKPFQGSVLLEAIREICSPAQPLRNLKR